MARKQKHEEHENHERWLVSYADFITLLFAFFVVMYAVSSVNEGKYRVLSDSLVAAFRSSAKTMDPIQIGEIAKNSKQPSVVNNKIQMLMDQPNAGGRASGAAIAPFGGGSEHGAGEDATEKAAGAALMRRMADRIEKAMAPLIEKDLIAVRSNSLWLEVEIKTSILFPSGVAKLEAEALPILRDLARILRDFPNPVRVEGFTDNVPISTAVFPSNWELSAARAASVVNVFARSGVEPQRMAAIGFGEHRPIADNTTEDGRNKNRRVVIVVLESAMTGAADGNWRDVPAMENFLFDRSVLEAVTAGGPEASGDGALPARPPPAISGTAAPVTEVSATESADTAVSSAHAEPRMDAPPMVAPIQIPPPIPSPIKVPVGREGAAR